MLRPTRWINGLRHLAVRNDIVSSSVTRRSTSSASSIPSHLETFSQRNPFHLASNQKRQHRRHDHSTSAAVATQYSDPEEDEEQIDAGKRTRARRNIVIVEEPVETPHVQVHVVKNSGSKPRLEALRKQLKNEPSVQSFLGSKTNTNGAVETTNGTQPQSAPKVIHWKELLKKSQEAPSPPRIDSEDDDDQVFPQVQEAKRTTAVLTDRFGRQHNYLRISLAERCNLRCTYCMPPEGVPLQPQSQLLQTPEILSLARHFQKHGVNKIRLTGGEPTLRKDLVDILQGLQQMSGFDELAITTNGVTLAKNLEDYVNAGLNRVNISLDTLHPEKFETLTRRPAAYFHKVWKAIEVATAMDPDKLVTKINVVVMKGVNDDEIADFCALQQRFPNLHVRFIEYMPFTENGWNMDRWVPYKDLLQQLEQQDQVQLVKLPEMDPNDTTKWYTTLENSQLMGHLTNNGSTSAAIQNGQSVIDKNQTKHGIGKIGFITSMSQPFCGTCNRLRLTSDGQIKVCLFDGNSTISLRDALREGADPNDLDLLIQHALRKKHFSLGGHNSPEDILLDSDHNRPMTLIGG